MLWKLSALKKTGLIRLAISEISRNIAIKVMIELEENQRVTLTVVITIAPNKREYSRECLPAYVAGRPNFSQL
jgi:hypothetical protein